MHAELGEHTRRTTSGPSTRARILAAASELFYAQGIRATSADRIIEQVGVTKVTFYRHFRSKGELVIHYLEQQAEAERNWMQSVHRPGDPVGTLRALALGIGEASCRPGFRGCAFINAAAEFSDAQDPVRQAVDAHRRWMFGFFTEVAGETEPRRAAAVARQLMLLRDGGMVSGYLGTPEEVADSLAAAFASVVAATRPT